MLSRRTAAVYRRSMRARPRLARAAIGSAAISLGLAWLTAPSAVAQATCSFDLVTGTVEVTLVGSAAATISRQGDAIAVDGTPCGAATVANTDTVDVAGSGVGQEDDLTIDLSGGAFAPGKEGDEGDGGDPEIEFTIDLPGGGVVRVVGTAGADALTLGSAGANLNAGEPVGDADVTLSGPASWELRGAQGPDELRLSGGQGTGGPASGAAAFGGTGQDLLLAGAGGGTLDGGGGTDTASFARASAVRADLSEGRAKQAGLPADDLANVENLVGSPGSDMLIGDGADNRLEGGGGRDRLDGRKGDDVLKGGRGRDTLDMRAASSSATVNLAKGRAEGLGEDTLVGIEDVIGTDRGDLLIGSDGRNELLGRGGRDEIRGGAGRDLLSGGLGGDDLAGGDDADTLVGGKGRDQLDGGDGRDTCTPGPDPDAWTSCEVVKL